MVMGKNQFLTVIYIYLFNSSITENGHNMTRVNRHSYLKAKLNNKIEAV